MEYKTYLIKYEAPKGYVIKPKGKGSVPVVLRGGYTSTKEAMKVIDAYKIKDKVKEDGKAKPAS